MFLTEEEVVILKQLYVSTRIGQINKYIIDNKCWVFHYWRKKLQRGKGGTWVTRLSLADGDRSLRERKRERPRASCSRLRFGTTALPANLSSKERRSPTHTRSWGNARGLWMVAAAKSLCAGFGIEGGLKNQGLFFFFFLISAPLWVLRSLSLVSLFAA